MFRLAPLAIAAMLPVAVHAQDVVATPGLSGTRLDIAATGEVTRTPDVATINAGVVTQAGGAAKAMADNASRMTATIAALRKAGVADRDIRTASLRLSPQYRYADNQPPVLTGYQAANQVTVRFRDIAKTGSILDALVAAGANQIDGPNFAVDKPEAALDEARTDAVKRARARAELYAAAAGMRVARVISIAEAGQNAGEPGPQPMFMARAVAADARTEIAPGEKDVTVTLAVRFLLQ